MINDGTVKWEIEKIVSDKELDTALILRQEITGSKQSEFTTSPSSSNGTGSTTEIQTLKGIGEGEYTLKDLLQRLVTISHSHQSQKGTYNCNCVCNCYTTDSCSCSSCIIDGNILTSKGYIPIYELKAGHFICDNKGIYHEVKGVKTSVLGNRNAIRFTNDMAIYTDDHLFLIGENYWAYDVDGYYNESAHNLTDGLVYGTYSRQVKRDVNNLEDVMVFNMEKSTITYTPIVENCEWCIVNGRIVACARFINEKFR